MKTRFLVVIGAAALMAGCAQETLTPLEPWKGDWAEYADRNLGFRFEYPTFLTTDHDPDGGVALRYQGRAINVRVVYITEDRGRGRGLWFGHKSIGDVQLAGRVGKKYFYRHYDGPAYIETMSYVIPYRDRYLGVEFRPGGIAEADRERLLQSFEVLEVQ